MMWIEADILGINLTPNLYNAPAQAIHSSDVPALRQSQRDLLSVRSCIVTSAMKVPQTNARGWGVDHTRTCSRPAQTAQLQHFFSAVVSCYTLAHTVELTSDMVELMLPNGSNSSPQDFVVYAESTLPRHEEMSLDRYHLFIITSLYKAFEVTKVKVHCIKVRWLSSSVLFYHCDHFRWGLTPDLLQRIFLVGPPTHCKLVGIHRFTVIGSYNNRNPALGVLWSWHRVASPSHQAWFYSRPECHKIFIGVTIIIFRYEYKE